MKYLISIFALFISLHASAVNYLSFGGGNYVYAEQNNLYFNLDTNTFDHRKWSYDGEKFTSEISIKLDLKTKYTSSDWVEQVLAHKKSDGLMYANYIKQPFNYQSRGGYQKVFLPAAAWALGGFVARSAALNAFRKYAVGAAGLAAAGLALDQFCKFMNLSQISCAADAATKAFTRTVTYAYELREQGNHGMGTFTVRATPSQYNTDNGLANVVRPHVAQKHTSNGQKLKDCTSTAGSGFVWCNYPKDNGQDDWFTTDYFSGLSQPITITEIVSDPEIDQYIDATCRLFPSECVNEPTGGKNINDVQLAAGSISGGVSVIGPPYTNPITGEAQQDKVVIGGASSSSGIPSSINSAWDKNATLGQSTTANSVNVSTTGRPDLTNTGTAPIAKPNEQTGTKPQVIVPPITLPEFTDLNDMIDFCKANPNALSCVEVEQVDESEIEIPQVTENLNLQVKNYITSSAGVCPQGSTFSVSMFGVTQTAEFSFTPACQFAGYLKYAVWAAAWLLAAQIVMGRNQS